MERKADEKAIIRITLSYLKIVALVSLSVGHTFECVCAKCSAHLIGHSWPRYISLCVQVLYMWSLDGDSLIFPPGVSLTVGNRSSVRHLVLQVHYVSKEFIPDTGDTSGLVVEYQTDHTEFAAGQC